jgi:hypothetical protein
MNSFKKYYKKYEELYEKYFKSKEYLEKLQKKYSKNIFMQKNLTRKIKPFIKTIKKKCNKLATRKVFEDYHFLTFNFLNVLKISFNIMTFLLLNRFKFMVFGIYIIGEIVQWMLILKLQIPKMIFLYNIGQGMFFVLFLFVFVGNSLKGNIYPGILFDLLVILFNLGLFVISLLYAFSPKLETLGKVHKKKPKKSA